MMSGAPSRRRFKRSLSLLGELDAQSGGTRRDIREIAKGLLKMAEKGDVSAARLLLGYCITTALVLKILSVTTLFAMRHLHRSLTFQTPPQIPARHRAPRLPRRCGPFYFFGLR